MRTLVVRNNDGSFTPIAGQQRLRLLLELTGMAEVEDASNGELLYVHEVGEKVVMVSLAANAELMDIAKQLLELFKKAS